MIPMNFPPEFQNGTVPVTMSILAPEMEQKPASSRLESRQPLAAMPKTLPAKPTDIEIILDEPELSPFQRWVAKLSPLQSFNAKAFSVSLPHLPSHLDGLRVVQLSDLQCYEYAPVAYWKKVIKTVHDLNPDVIVITGDMIHYGNRYVKQTQDILNYLPKQKTDGTPIIRVACMGNHDYMDREAKPGKFDLEDGQFVFELLENAGFTVLVDKAMLVLKDTETQQGLWISAIDDYEHITMSEGRSLENSFNQLFSQIEPNQAHLMLSHNPHPDIIQKAAAHADKAPGLVLSGHTHGGQWSSPVPGIRQLMDVMRSKVVYGPYSNQYLIGGYAVNNSYVYVNAGTGSSIRAANHNFLPLRVGSTPEISIFDLKSADGEKTSLVEKTLH